jgi:mannose-6-phosphate isomerase-like protein (cupin superfamily)
MVSANMRRLLVGVAAIAANLGWLQLAPAFGFPVTAPVGMLDRILGPTHEAGAPGWTLLLLGQAAIAALAFVLVEPRTQRWLASFGFAVGAWLLSGAVLMPLVAYAQAISGPVAAADPMRVEFFMLNLGPGAAAESLIGWLLFGAVIAAGSALDVRTRTVALAVGAAAFAAAIAFAVPALAQAASDRVVEGRIAALPAPPVFISVLELPQPAGAVLGPHSHIPGFVFDVFGTATMVIDGTAVNVAPGDAFFTANLQLHDHENRAAVPYAMAGALVIVGLVAAIVLLQGRMFAAPLMAALLVAGTVATVNPLMNHWYFIGVRPAAMRGAPMLVPAAHRTYESENLTGFPTGPSVERLTHRRIGPGESLRVVGPAAIVVLDGNASVVADGRTTTMSAQSGTTIPGGTEATIQAGSGSPRVLVVEVVPTS